jgi:hypothetical protein
MKRPHLRACPTCARHVRVSEEACPFCRGRLAESFRAAPAPQPPGARLTRAALFAFGTGTLALAPACSSSSSTTTVNDAGGSQPAYGGFPIEEDGSTQALYGAPAFDGGGISVDAGTDAGSESDATEASDAEDGGPMGTAAYGAPASDF